MNELDRIKELEALLEMERMKSARLELSLENALDLVEDLQGSLEAWEHGL